MWKQLALTGVGAQCPTCHALHAQFTTNGLGFVLMLRDVYRHNSTGLNHLGIDGVCVARWPMGDNGFFIDLNCKWAILCADRTHILTIIRFKSDFKNVWIDLVLRHKRRLRCSILLERSLNDDLFLTPRGMLAVISVLCLHFMATERGLLSPSSQVHLRFCDEQQMCDQLNGNGRRSRRC